MRQRHYTEVNTRDLPYLDAGNSRDLQTMRALVEGSREPQLVPGCCEILLRDNMVDDDVEVGAGAPTSGEGTMADGWERVVRVPVEFHIIQSDGQLHLGWPDRVRVPARPPPRRRAVADR